MPYSIFYPHFFFTKRKVSTFFFFFFIFLMSKYKINDAFRWYWTRREKKISTLEHNKRNIPVSSFHLDFFFHQCLFSHFVYLDHFEYQYCLDTDQTSDRLILINNNNNNKWYSEKNIWCGCIILVTLPDGSKWKRRASNKEKTSKHTSQEYSSNFQFKIATSQIQSISVFTHHFPPSSRQKKNKIKHFHRPPDIHHHQRRIYIFVLFSSFSISTFFFDINHHTQAHTLTIHRNKFQMDTLERNT